MKAMPFISTPGQCTAIDGRVAPPARPSSSQRCRERLELIPCKRKRLKRIGVDAGPSGPASPGGSWRENPGVDRRKFPLAVSRKSARPVCLWSHTMKIRQFGVEIWMNRYETTCELNLAETCVESLTVAELLEMA